MSVPRAAFLCLAAAALLASGTGSPAPPGKPGPSRTRPRPGVKAPACLGGAPVVVEILAGNRSVASFWAMEGNFGSHIPVNGTGVFSLAEASPVDGCAKLSEPQADGQAMLVQRGECEFSVKARNVQATGSTMMLVANNSTDCLQMYVGDEKTLTSLESLWAASISSEAAADLAGLLKNETELGVVLWGVKAGLDTSSAVLFLIAVGTVVSGSIWSARDHMAMKAQLSQGLQGEPVEQALPTQDLTERHAALFIFAASLTLVVLFFFIGSIVIFILVCLFALISWQALTLMLAPAVAWAFPALRKGIVAVPCLGAMNWHEVVAACTSMVVTLVWVLCRHEEWAWLLQDILGVSVCILFLRTVQLPNLKVAMILLPLAFVYDVFWVFIEPMIFSGPSVMVKVATGGDAHDVMPMVLQVPYLLMDLPGFSILGLGDIVLPGLLVTFCRTVDVVRGQTLARGYFLPISLGYATGLILTYLALCFRIGGSSGQPALLYLVPCTLGTMVILALIRGDLRSLVLGRDGKLAKIEDREALPGSGRSSDFGAGSSEHAQLLEHS